MASVVLSKVKRMNQKYELNLGLYVLEPWEKYVVNTFVMVCVFFVVSMLARIA
ncbi:hypothetical protein DL89DRAFT_266285 [Linderina pennispora]|uniref:Uncharacterized protein n=1 Tax=Linderina pennispora TaxID=61395 RepID=A0A1Y1WCK4_9FUNG|nr:uncharacterized protein DL89DRAFT_266285 [Linderina pennispora]ORX71269.1 hypothetical protein DL89DRAFT_266285 [Linderina pennispora]